MITNFISSFIICFSMYSVIPMPIIDWDKKNMKYVFCFFPLVGILIGILQYFWFLFALKFNLNSLFYATTATIISVLISGGIHIDGLVDTCDAIFSYGDKEKRLKILKDPLVGAFGVIYCIVYLLAMTGLYSQLFSSLELIDPTKATILIIIFALSRTIAGFITIWWKSSKDSGLKHIFSEGTNKKFVTYILSFWIIVLSLCIVFISFNMFLLAIVLVLFFTICFYFYSKKTFGGITGDLVGFYICIIELLLLFCFVIGVVLKLI